MRIKLETLQHQTDALAAINQAFPGMEEYSNVPDADYIYANPLIKGRYEDKNNIDIKMETGTGKTYVYTRMMYDWHQKYGLFKFVIVVPSPGIKEGTRSFIESDYAKQHFSESYENTRVQLNVINAGDFRTHSGRRNFPAQLSEFVEATRQNASQIQVLLINADMLHSKSMQRADYDQTLLGGETSPLKAIKTVRSVVIIDEPHRFTRDKKYYKDIEAIRPQLIVRFGATFPQITIGRGKDKETKIDYYRGKPQYNLNAINSFNQGLVKGIRISYPTITKEEASNLYKVKYVKPKELTLTKAGKDYTLERHESLGKIDKEFIGGITYEGGIDHELSNGLALSKGMQLIPGTFAENYQDEIISEAIDCHFAAEIINFMRPNAEENAAKIKTLSLFFIDSIDSFRGENNSKGWLAEHFENILTKKLQALLQQYELAKDEREKEYHSFLQATLASLKSEHQDIYAGYFSKDRNNTDEDIQSEVDDILKNKEKLLSFKDAHGNWLTRRFLFSKWTLREGWDNPNVFVIAKLRSSGSETSKIQEVGRGLRLPVDETGHRLNQDEWSSQLSFLISYDEQDFAQRLVGEINDDAPIKLNHDELTQEMIDLVVKKRQKNEAGFTEDKLLDDLDAHNVVTRSNKFKDKVQFDNETMSGYEAFIRLYPEIFEDTKVTSDKVYDANKNNLSTQVKLRKSNWAQLKKLWKQLAKRQMVVYDDTVNSEAEFIIRQVFEDATKDLFVRKRPQINEDEIFIADYAVVRDTKYDYNSTYITMNYGKFLQQLAVGTSISVNLLNNLMIEKMAQLDNDKNYINEDTLVNLVREFNSRFNNILKTHYRYEPLDFRGATSIYDNKKDDFVDSVQANALGVFSATSTDDPKYLYDRPPLRYDSADPELKLLKRTYGDKIKVFGKLPKAAIKIPRYDHGTTTPDFIFMIERASEKNIYLIVETKAENMRIGDEVIESIQKNYFDKLSESGVYYQMATSEQDVRQKLQKLEEEK